MGATTISYHRQVVGSRPPRPGVHHAMSLTLQNRHILNTSKFSSHCNSCKRWGGLARALISYQHIPHQRSFWIHLMFFLHSTQAEMVSGGTFWISIAKVNGKIMNRPGGIIAWDMVPLVKSQSASSPRAIIKQAVWLFRCSNNRFGLTFPLCILSCLTKPR